MNKDRITIDINIMTVMKVILAIILVALIYYIKEIFILVFISFILAITIEPIVKRLQKKKIPRVVSILGIFCALIGLFFVSLEIIIPTLTIQIYGYINNLPSIINEAGHKLFPDNPDITRQLSNQALDYVKNLKSAPTGAITGIFGVALNIVTFFVNILVVFILTFYLLLEKEGVGRVIFRYLPLKDKDRVINVFDKVTKKLSNWLKGQLLLSGFIGIITYIVLIVLGFSETALALSLFAALTSLIPVVGPLIALIPAALLAISISSTKLIAVVIAYFAIQQVENHILVPQIMKKAIGLSPVVVVISLLIGAKLLGIIGILLAVPVTASLFVILDDLYAKNDVNFQD